MLYKSKCSCTCSGAGGKQKLKLGSTSVSPCRPTRRYQYRAEYANRCNTSSHAYKSKVCCLSSLVQASGLPPRPAQHSAVLLSSIANAIVSTAATRYPQRSTGTRGCFLKEGRPVGSIILFTADLQATNIDPCILYIGTWYIGIRNK